MLGYHQSTGTQMSRSGMRRALFFPLATICANPVYESRYCIVGIVLLLVRDVFTLYLVVPNIFWSALCHVLLRLDRPTTQVWRV
jgi:hypothetical protein